MTCKVSSERDFSSHSSGVVVHTIIYLRTFLPRFTTTSRQPHPFLATCFFLSNTTLTAESNIDFAFVQQNSAKVEKFFQKRKLFSFSSSKVMLWYHHQKKRYHLGITFLYRRVSLCPLLSTLAKYPTAKWNIRILKIRPHNITFSYRTIMKYSAYLLDNQNKISGIYINVNTTYTFWFLISLKITQWPRWEHKWLAWNHKWLAWGFRDSAGVSCFFLSKNYTYRHIKSLDNKR